MKSNGGSKHMHDLMAGYVARGEIPGLVTAVSRRGDTQVDAIGTKALGARDPVRRDTIFRIASMTKPVAAAAAMILIEDGMLKLDEPVDRLLPELANRRVLRRLDAALDDTVPAVRAIAVRDLLTFTMGFGLLFAPPGTYPIKAALDALDLGQGPPTPAKVPAPDEWMRRLGTLPLMHHPGEAWMYNTGADVLGVLVARASGVPFETFLHERIFEPLGMNDTSFSVPASKLDRFLPTYVANAKTGGFDVYDEVSGQWSRPPAFAGGGAGLVSTADDFLAFGQMLLDDGRHSGARILSKASVQAMTTDQLTPEQKASRGALPGLFDTHGWGFGMAVVTKSGGEAPVGSFGWDGGFGTSWRSDPTEGVVGILLTQRMWTTSTPPPVCGDFWRAVYA